MHVKELDFSQHRAIVSRSPIAEQLENLPGIPNQPAVEVSAMLQSRRNLTMLFWPEHAVYEPE